MKKLTRYIIDSITYGSESKEVEFKPPFKWEKHEKARKVEIVKAALGFANTNGGGYIVIGISQEQDRSNGVIFRQHGLTEEQFNSFNNPDDIGRFINNYCHDSIKFVLYGSTV